MENTKQISVHLEEELWRDFKKCLLFDPVNKTLAAWVRFKMEEYIEQHIDFANSQ